MRRVILDGRDGPLSDVRRRDKLAGHLHARLAEYEEEGIRAELEGGTVRTRFPGMDGEKAARRLAEQNVFARAEGGCVRFFPGPEVTFEDLDYVQSVSARMLL